MNIERRCFAVTTTKFFALIFLFAFSVPAWSAPAAPDSVPGGYQAGAIVRVFKKLDPFSLVGEVSAVQETGGRQYKDFTLGTYYHLTPFLKVGAFYTRAYGLRHDEDWVAPDGNWGWNDSNGRGENIFALDGTARALLGFLPGEDWVGEIKTRYIYNAFDFNRTFFVRPGVTYFYMRGGQLIANFFAQVELDFPLNFSSQSMSEKWIYFGSLCHVNETIEMGPYVALGWQTWSAPSQFTDRGGDRYAITTQTTTLGLSSVIRF